MIKKTGISIYQFENYIQMQKLNLISKIIFNNEELTSQSKKIRTIHTIDTKWSIRICCQARILATHTVFTDRKKR